jgi:hypothetical protein
MDDERQLPGMPVMHRQEMPVRRDLAGRPIVPSRVPETRPTPLQERFIPLSVIVLVCGVVAISALELGTPLAAPLVKVPVLIGAAVLAVVTLDAIVRIWRSVIAWRRVDRGRALFRLVWAATLVASLAVVAVLAIVVLRA